MALQEAKQRLSSVCWVTVEIHLLGLEGAREEHNHMFSVPELIHGIG
jgi:hypothetical protein